MSRRLLSLTLLVAVLVAALFYHWRGPLSMLLVPRFAQQHFAEQPLQSLADGLHVGLCGAGSPFPDPQRGAPCTLVVAGKRLLVFDAGISAAPNLSRMGFDAGQIEAVFLTHFHSDHIGGLGELMLQRWGMGSHTEPLPVYGPLGVQSVVDGFNQAYRLDHTYRIAHHGPQVMPPSGSGAQAKTFTAGGAEGRVVLIDEPDLQVVAFTVAHAPVEPAVGYRIRYKDRSLVISGDTRKSAAVQREAAGVDVLLHEALSPQLMAMLGRAASEAGRTNLAQILADIPDYHSSPEQAAEIARDAGVAYLVLNHIAPPLPVPGLAQAFLGQAERIYAGPVRVGQDGDFISLPAGSTAIHTSNRL
jgi:ribonuclease Z